MQPKHLFAHINFRMLSQAEKLDLLMAQRGRLFAQQQKLLERQATIERQQQRLRHLRSTYERRSHLLQLRSSSSGSGQERSGSCAENGPP